MLANFLYDLIKSDNFDKERLAEIILIIGKLNIGSYRYLNHLVTTLSEDFSIFMFD